MAMTILDINVVFRDTCNVSDGWCTSQITVETVQSPGDLPDADGLGWKVKLHISNPGLSQTGARINAITYIERPIHKLVLIVENDSLQK